MRAIDLHTHSVASDGSKTPSEIIEMAERLGLAAVALTDHDTISGLPEFIARGATSPIAIVPGVEVAVNWNHRELHILGFFVSTECPTLNALLQEIRDNRDKRNELIIAKLRENGVNISIDDVLKVANGESVGRPHIARVLVEKGYYKTPKDVFSECLARGGTGYAPRLLPEPKIAIDAIRAAGGSAFWAHPTHRDKSEMSAIRSTMEYFLGLGIDGVEAYYTEFSIGQHQAILKMAETLGVPVCGGTDYHGDNQPGIDLGVGRGDLFVPESVYDRLAAYHQAKTAAAATQ